MSSTLWPNRSKAAPARCLPRPATTSWPRLLNLKYAMPAALSRVDSSRISGCPEENADPRPCTQMSAAAPPAAPRFGDDAVEPDAVASAEADERDGNACRPCHARTPAGFAEAVNRKSVWLSSSAPGPRWRRGRRRRLASQRGTLIRAGESRRVHAVRFLKYELLAAILSLWNVKMSQPLTSTFLPSAVVPEKIHSDTPRLPATKWGASPNLASGKILNTPANPPPPRSRPR